MKNFKFTFLISASVLTLLLVNSFLFADLLLPPSKSQSKNIKPLPTPSSSASSETSNWNLATDLLGKTKAELPPGEPSTTVTVQTTCTDQAGNTYASTDDQFSRCVAETRTNAIQNQKIGVGKAPVGNDQGVKLNYKLGK
jgi:hypothetical protein